MRHRNPNELARDWLEIQQDLAAIRKRAVALPPLGEHDVYDVTRRLTVMRIRSAELEIELMRGIKQDGVAE